MCGIAGAISFDRGALEDLQKVVDALDHRGPDGRLTKVFPEAGIALGHTRLSIIDPSPAGDQPLSNEDGTVWTVFNGEIYNFRRLKKKLIAHGHKFCSNSDTEVLVHGYEEWGTELVEHLNGIYAFAVADLPRQEVFIARDRFGVKPLYYYRSSTSDTFVFASELPALLSHPSVGSTIDHSALWDFLTYLYVPAPKTAYQDIREIEPARFARVSKDGFAEQKYWDIEFNTDRCECVDQFVDETRKTIVGAIHRNLLSDVPLGFLCSGGLDSSSVVAAAAEVGERQRGLRLYTLGIGGSRDERAFAKVVGDRYATCHNIEMVEFESGGVSEILEIFGQPYGDGSYFPTKQVTWLASRDVKTVLSGDGGDEVFGGYKWYDGFIEMEKKMRSGPVSSAQRALRKVIDLCHGLAWKNKMVASAVEKISSYTWRKDPVERYGLIMGRLFPIQKRKLFPKLAREHQDYDDYWFIRKHWKPELDIRSRLQYVDMHTYLPNDILRKVDMASMQNSLEVRVPLLDHQLAEFVASLPVECRVNKRILKEVARDWLPGEIITRKKRGFSIPLDEITKKSPRCSSLPESLNPQGRYQTCLLKQFTEPQL